MCHPAWARARIAALPPDGPARPDEVPGPAGRDGGPAPEASSPARVNSSRPPDSRTRAHGRSLTYVTSGPCGPARP